MYKGPIISSRLKYFSNKDTILKTNKPNQGIKLKQYRFASTKEKHAQNTLKFLEQESFLINVKAISKSQNLNPKCKNNNISNSGSILSSFPLLNTSQGRLYDLLIRLTSRAVNFIDVQLNSKYECPNQPNLKTSEFGRVKFKNLCSHKFHKLNHHNSCTLWHGDKSNFLMFYSTSVDKGKKSEKKVEVEKALSYRQQLQILVKEYGAFILVFYITLSLISLGCCYLIIESGAYQSDFFSSWGISEGASTAGVAAKIVVAYAIHKTLAPWRAALTVGLAPFLVKKYKHLKYLKSTKPKQN